MIRNSAPAKFPIAFGAGASPGDLNYPIPTPSQIGITPGAASLTDGFPPLNFDPVGSGGIAPWGRDFNGLFFQITAWLRYNANAGGTNQCDNTFSTQVGGYPFGAILSAATGVTGGSPQGGNHLWLSLVDNNSVNPDTTFDGTMSNWLPFPAVINTTVAYTVGGNLSNFTDLNAAMAYLNQFEITQNGFVELQLASGTFTYTQSVTFSHPNNDRISITGTMAAPLPLVEASYALNGNSAGQRATDTATNLAMLRTKFNTELHFSNCAGFIFIGRTPGIDGVLLTGDGSNFTGLQINATSGNTATSSNGVAIVNFGQNGILVEHGALISATSFVILGCGLTNAQITAGIWALHGWVHVAGSILVFACGVSGLPSPGILIQDGGGFNMFQNSLFVECNQNDGITIANAGSMDCTGVATCHFYKNGGWGLRSVSSVGKCATTDFGTGGNANGSGPVTAVDMGFVNVGLSINTSGSVPAVGSVGNNNSLISTT